jgi:hypothetical protein
VDPGPISFILLLPFTFTLTVYFLAYYYCFPLDTLNTLFTANRWDWQPHRKLGAKFLVVLCVGSTLLLVKKLPLRTSIFRRRCLECLEASKHHPSEVWLSPTGSITSVSYWGKTCYCAHHTFLLGFPTGRLSARIKVHVGGAGLDEGWRWCGPLVRGPLVVGMGAGKYRGRACFSHSVPARLLHPI